VQVIIPPSETGTIFSEIISYQLPVDYVTGDPRPMVIAWHGFGLSANSVSVQSTLDEECNARGWIFLAPTGVDDKLFGSPICQQHAEVAIHYMMNHFSVDPDRLYMVGFSMGGGVVASFAERHRDPAGLMIAALGTVSGAFDHAETYLLGNSATQSIMENPYNFGGSVSRQPFHYEQVSSLFHVLGSYPPTPGTVDAALSMGDNLDTLPVWMTWDTGDPLVENTPVQAVQLAALIGSVGGTVETHPVSGTLDPVTQLPAPHSWAVLDEAELFDFFAGKVVNRTPAVFRAQLDRDEVVSFASVVQHAPDAFSFVDGSAGPGALGVEHVANVETLVTDLGAADVAGTSPLHATASSADGDGFTLGLAGAGVPPSYLVESSSGALVTGTQSDPVTGSLSVGVPPLETLDVQAITAPWTAKLLTAPDPVAIGGSVTVSLDGNRGTSVSAFLIVSTAELLTPIKGGSVITASLPAPSALIQLPLDAAGDFAFTTALPGDPALSGLHLVLQAVAIDASNGVDAVSNLRGMHIL
jgi:acetyl esterase/lipase